MSCISTTDKYIAVAKNLLIDLYDYSNHNIVEVPISKSQENDKLSDIIVSADNKHLAAITAISKQLIVYDLPISSKPKIFTLPRSASKIRFSTNNSHILVADKSGDVLIYDINKEDSGTKLLGHLSLLLDILQTSDGKFIITSDRDEKIRVSCYPNTYNIQTYCLGHKEFVNHIELLPHNNKYLLSSSGDGSVKVWDYSTGSMCYTMNTYNNVYDAQVKDNFTKKMDEEGIEVETLPIVHCTTTKLNDNASLLAVSVYTYNDILIYSINTSNCKFSDKLETHLHMDSFPSAIQLTKSSLIVYNDSECRLTTYNFTLENDKVKFEESKKENVFSTVSNKNLNGTENHFDSIKVLYKRKFDNVQEYQERKKQRLEKSGIKNIE